MRSMPALDLLDPIALQRNPAPMGEHTTRRIRRDVRTDLIANVSAVDRAAAPVTSVRRCRVRELPWRSDCCNIVRGLGGPESMDETDTQDLATANADLCSRVPHRRPPPSQ